MSRETVIYSLRVGDVVIVATHDGPEFKGLGKNLDQPVLLRQAAAEILYLDNLLKVYEESIRAAASVLRSRE